MPKLKSLFATPKKAALTAACFLVMLATLATAAVYAASAFGQGSAIGEDAAANFALAAAGVDPASASALRVEFDRADGRSVYEVKFTAGGAEYQYLIDAGDGSVVKKERESSGAAQPGGFVPSKDLEEAREIALADAGLTSADAVFTGERLVQDNGLWVYEFHFQTGGARFEYEINANTGAVYSKVAESYVAAGPAPVQTAAPVPESAPPSEPGPEPTPDPAPENTPQPAPSQDPAPSQSPAAQPAESGAPAYTHHPDGYDGGRTEGQGVGQVPDMTTGSSYIGADRAKSAALEHAGLTGSRVMFTKAALRRDGGRMVYEIGFRLGGVEYEYKIDARTGSILEHEGGRD